MARPIFSGHESFACKSHWLKRGYDFVIADRNFNDDDAVVHLGVGKNMVASIRFWLKAVGLLQDNELNPIADYLFNDENGQDPKLERIKSTPKTISIGGYEKRGVGNSNTSPKFKSFILFPPQVI